MKTAMIWGAAGGIGRALVDELLSKEWTVVAMSRHEDALSSVAAHSIPVELSDAFSVQRATQAASFEVTSVDLWVYAAGDIASSPVDEMTPDIWNRILSANLTGAYLAAHYSLPLLAPDAHMVFVGAISERLHLPGFSAYAAAKAGLEAMADTLRKEQRRRRVSVIRPAAVNTNLWTKVSLRKPKNAVSPSRIAATLIKAYDEGHSGVLDIA